MKITILNEVIQTQKNKCQVILCHTWILALTLQSCLSSMKNIQKSERYWDNEEEISLSKWGGRKKSYEGGKVVVVERKHDQGERLEDVLFSPFFRSHSHSEWPRLTLNSWSCCFRLSAWQDQSPAPAFETPLMKFSFNRMHRKCTL